MSRCMFQAACHRIGRGLKQLVSYERCVEVTSGQSSVWSRNCSTIHEGLADNVVQIWVPILRYRIRKRMDAVAGRLFFPPAERRWLRASAGLAPPGEGITNSFLERYEVLVEMGN